MPRSGKLKAFNETGDDDRWRDFETVSRGRHFVTRPKNAPRVLIKICFCQCRTQSLSTFLWIRGYKMEHPRALEFDQTIRGEMFAPLMHYLFR